MEAEREVPNRFFMPVQRKGGDLFCVVADKQCDRPARYEELASYISRFYSPKIADVESSGRVFRVTVFHPKDANDLAYVLTDSDGTPAGEEFFPIRMAGKITEYLEGVSDQVRLGEAILQEQVPDIGAHFLPPNLSRTAIWTCNAGRDALAKSRCFWMEPLERRRVVILGDAGAGKTTLIRRFAMEMASRSLAEYGEAQPLVPIYIQLRNDGWRHIDSIVRRRVSTCVEADETAEATDKLLASGYVLVLLDGVDEVLDEERGDCIREIKEFADGHANVRVILTCRFSAYQQPLAEFDHFCIDPLEKTQMREFILMRLGRRRDLDRFIGRLETEPALESVTSSPLLLSLLLARFQRDETSPHHLAHTVGEFVAVLSDTWDSSRGIVRSRSRALRPMFRKNILEELASKTVQSSSDTFSESDLDTVLACDIDKRAEVLAGIARATGIIERTGDGNWRFGHRFIMEYLASVFLLEAARDIGSELAHCLTSDTWRSIWRFVCGAASRSGDLVTSTLPSNPDTSEKKLRHCLLVADALTESVSLTHSAVSAFGETLMSLGTEVLRAYGATVAESVSWSKETQMARLRIRFPSRNVRNEQGHNVEQLLTSFLRLRDGSAYDEVIRLFRGSDDQILIEFSKIMECEGRVYFSSPDDSSEIDCTITLRQ